MTPFITRLGFWAGALCSHRGGYVLILHPSHHGSGVQTTVHNLVDNSETKQCKWHHLMTKFSTSLQQIIKYTQKKYKSDFKKYNLKLRNMRASQLRFSSQTEQTLSTCVLILSSFLKRLDVFMHTLDSKFRYMITIIIVAQNDPIHNQAGILSGSIVFSPRRICPDPPP